jgi:hypothetical protein
MGGFFFSRSHTVDFQNMMRYRSGAALFDLGKGRVAKVGPGRTTIRPGLFS